MGNSFINKIVIKTVMVPGPVLDITDRQVSKVESLPSEL